MEMLKHAYHFSFGLIADFSPTGDSFGLIADFSPTGDLFSLIADFSPKVTPKNTIFRIFSKMHQNEPTPFDEFCIFLQR